MFSGLTGWAWRPEMVGAVKDGYCMLLTGLPVPDFNIVLVDTAEPTALSAALADVEAVGAPALIALAAEGAGQARALPVPWQVVAQMPIMALELRATAEPDARVRMATPQDAADVGRVWADAYGFDLGVAVDAAELIVSAPVLSRTWLLEDAGHVVSAVVTTHVEDTVSIWAMATPPQLARRGYGRALLSTVLTAAAEHGARLALLGATEAGYPLYESTGWKTIEQWTVAVSGESAQFH
jgi:GNAT superfamily N-acetyltransferase